MKYIIGIDEVGRGALAGPVAVAAVLLPRNFQFSIFNFQKKSKIKLKDSKKLSPKQREIWFYFIKQQKIPFVIVSVSPKMIDKINISQAANLAAGQALGKLLVKSTIVKMTSKIKILLDGGLYLIGQVKNNKMQKFTITFNNRSAIKCNIFVKTVVKGDEKIPAISLASIIAKVNRDKYMKKLHKKYPQYDFIHNVGYGTKKHINAIKKYDLSPIHRRSFKI